MNAYNKLTFLFLFLFLNCYNSLAQEYKKVINSSFEIPNQKGLPPIINEPYYFEQTVFSEIATFNNTTFKEDVGFFYSRFNKNSSFVNCSFLNGVDFSSVTFCEEANFIDSKFDQKDIYHLIQFDNTKFKNAANFMLSDFLKWTTFRQAIFSKSANYTSSTFRETPDFDETQLPDSLFFMSVNLTECKTPIRFDLANIDSLQKRHNNNRIKCKIYLNTFTNLDKIVLDASKFQLSFYKEASYEERLSVFGKIIKTCKDFGFQESAISFDIELQKLQIRHSSTWGWAAPVVIWLSEYWWNFGYDKSKAYRNTAISFALCFLLFFVGIRFFLTVYLPSQLNVESEEIKNLKGRTRLKVSLFYTALIFFSWKMEHGDVKYRSHPWGALLIYVIFTIGIIHLAYLAGAILNK